MLDGDAEFGRVANSNKTRANTATAAPAKNFSSEPDITPSRTLRYMNFCFHLSDGDALPQQHSDRQRTRSNDVQKCMHYRQAEENVNAYETSKVEQINATRNCPHYEPRKIKSMPRIFENKIKL